MRKQIINTAFLIISIPGFLGHAIARASNANVDTPTTYHRCRKGSDVVDYQVYHNQKKACALTYKYMQCRRKMDFSVKSVDIPCGERWWKTISGPKQIFAKSGPRDACEKRALHLVSYLEELDFQCTQDLAQ